MKSRVAVNAASAHLMADGLVSGVLRRIEEASDDAALLILAQLDLCTLGRIAQANKYWSKQSLANSLWSSLHATRCAGPHARVDGGPSRAAGAPSPRAAPADVLLQSVHVALSGRWHGAKSEKMLGAGCACVCAYTHVPARPSVVCYVSRPCVATTNVPNAQGAQLDASLMQMSA